MKRFYIVKYKLRFNNDDNRVYNLGGGNAYVEESEIDSLVNGEESMRKMDSLIDLVNLADKYPYLFSGWSLKKTMFTKRIRFVKTPYGGKIFPEDVKNWEFFREYKEDTSCSLEYVQKKLSYPDFIQFLTDRGLGYQNIVKN